MGQWTQPQALEREQPPAREMHANTRTHVSGPQGSPAWAWEAVKGSAVWICRAVGLTHYSRGLGPTSSGICSCFLPVYYRAVALPTRTKATFGKG